MMILDAELGPPPRAPGVEGCHICGDELVILIDCTAFEVRLVRSDLPATGR